MGFIFGTVRRLATVGLVGTTGAAAYLAARNPVISPLSPADPIWSSSLYKKHNPSRNPATQDVVIKRVPLDKIRPELIQKESDLTLELCRGVWSGWGYVIQRRYLDWKWRDPETAQQHWTNEQLATSDYAKGTPITDHFEVLDKSPTAITIRCGDSPRNQALRGSDGLFVIGAKIDKDHQEAELTLKSCLYSSEGTITGIKGPMPAWIEELHQWYVRLLLETASWKLLK